MRNLRIAPLLAALVLMISCAARPGLDVVLVGLTPVESTLLEQRLQVDFRIQNPSDQVIRAIGVELTLNVNDRRLARGVDDDSFLLTGLSEAEVSVVVSASVLDVARQLLELPGRDRFSYELSGRLMLDGRPRSVPFTRSGEITREELTRLAGIGDLRPQPLTL